MKNISYHEKAITVAIIDSTLLQTWDNRRQSLLTFGCSLLGNPLTGHVQSFLIFSRPFYNTQLEQ